VCGKIFFLAMYTVCYNIQGLILGFLFFDGFSAIYLKYSTRALVGFEGWNLGFCVSLRSLEEADTGAAP